MPHFRTLPWALQLRHSWWGNCPPCVSLLQAGPRLALLQAAPLQVWWQCWIPIRNHTEKQAAGGSGLERPWGPGWAWPRPWGPGWAWPQPSRPSSCSLCDPLGPLALLSVPAQPLATAFCKCQAHSHRVHFFPRLSIQITGRVPSCQGPALRETFRYHTASKEPCRLQLMAVAPAPSSAFTAPSSALMETMVPGRARALSPV